MALSLHSLSPASPWLGVLAFPSPSAMIISFLRPPSHAYCEACGTVSPNKPLFIPSLGYVFISSMKTDKYSKFIPVEWAVAEKILNNVEVTMGKRQRLEQFAGLRRRQESVGKFVTSQRLVEWLCSKS